MAKLDAFWVRRSEGGKREKCVTYLSPRNDDVLAPVLDAYRPVGVHDSQIAAMEVPTLERLLGGFLICEILRQRGKTSGDRMNKGCHVK